MMRSDVIDISAFIHFETEKAVLVSNDGDKAKAEWLPKSQIEIEQSGNTAIAEITLPESIATEKGLI